MANLEGYLPDCFVALSGVAWEVGFATGDVSELFELPPRLPASQARPPRIGWLEHPPRVNQDIPFLDEFDQFVEIQLAAVVFTIGHDDEGFLRMYPALKAVESKHHRINMAVFPLAVSPKIELASS
jgi:hypothetical protein